MTSALLVVLSVMLINRDIVWLVKLIIICKIMSVDLAMKLVLLVNRVLRLLNVLPVDLIINSYIPKLEKYRLMALVTAL